MIKVNYEKITEELLKGLGISSKENGFSDVI